MNMKGFSNQLFSYMQFASLSITVTAGAFSPPFALSASDWRCLHAMTTSAVCVCHPPTNVHNQDRQP
jgi:hypothetical protein